MSLDGAVTDRGEAVAVNKKGCTTRQPG